ncbi:MAG: dihydrolipoamide acetyltransferase family protein [Rubrivivax sp.]|nr:dihydrolipoamide acetyltransferase family protein [Rubrivivax sp.]
MGIHIIKMPDIGEGIAEVELGAWHVKPGDTVAEDQALADVLTDKANVEIPSPVAGRVLALGGRPGDVLAVGAELIRIEVEGAGNVAAGAAPVAAKAAAAVAAPAAAPAPAAPPAPAPVSSAATPPSAGVLAPAARPAAPPPRPAVAVARHAGDKPIASPAVRRRAWDLGIELQFVPGSGPGGRILHEDLDAHAARASTAPAAGDTRYAQRDDEEALPVIGLRRKIAQKMQESKRRIPHFSYVEEVDVTELEALRAQLNAQWAAERGKLTLLPLLARAIVLAVRRFPQINARFDDEAGVVTRYGAVHLGIATQTANGLMVPVLRHAEARDPWAVAAEVARLAEAARSGKALREELSGSTITVTSLGALGGIASTPVINAPEVAIVGVNRIVERPMYRAGALVPRLMMNLSSSFDHRVVDGMHAAEFVQALRGMLECPALLFVE